MVDAEKKNSVAPGIECDKVIQSILDVMHGNPPYTVIQRTMHIDPTVTESSNCGGREYLRNRPSLASVKPLIAAA